MSDNINALTDEQKSLVEKNHNLIYWFANKNNLNIDDYYDTLAIGLCKAARAFDSSKAVFSTHAFKCMQNELYTHWDNTRKKSCIPQECIMSYDIPMSKDDSYDSDIFLEKFSDSKSHDDMMYGIMSYEIENMLTKKERVVLGFIKSGFTHKEIAEKLNCNRSNVTYFVNRIRQKANQYLYSN
jgi:RNA polymerase sporulation-specific sigma factor